MSSGSNSLYPKRIRRGFGEDSQERLPPGLLEGLLARFQTGSRFTEDERTGAGFGAGGAHEDCPAKPRAACSYNGAFVTPWLRMS